MTEVPRLPDPAELPSSEPSPVLDAGVDGLDDNGARRSRLARSATVRRCGDGSREPGCDGARDKEIVGVGGT